MTNTIRAWTTLVVMVTGSVIARAETIYPKLPQGITSFGGAIVNDWLYVYGGHTGRAHRYSNTSQSNELIRLNLKKPEKWEVIATGPRLQGLAMVAYQGKLYRIGGFNALNKEGEKHKLQSVADVACFDVKTKKWTKLPPLPEPRSSHDAIVIGSKIYVVGGWQLGKARKWHTTAWVMDLSQKKLQWQALAKPPFQRRALSLGQLDGKLYAIGGMTRSRGPTTQVDVYCPKSDEWTEAKSLQGRGMEGFGSSAFHVGGRLYVSTYAGNLQRLDREGAEWRTVKKLDEDRFFHRMLPYGKRLILVGGASMRAGKRRRIETVDLSAWTGFRGDGTSRARANNLPLEWSAKKNIAWTANLPGYGQSSPVVWGDRVFVTSSDGPNKEKCLITAYDVRSGKELWKKSVAATQTVKASMMVSRAAPTPCVDSTGLYVFFESGELLKLSHGGDLKWQRSLVKEYGKFKVGHGIGSSLTQTPDSVIVLIDHEGPSYLLAVNKANGKNLWKTERKSRISWTSPVIASREGKLEVIVSSNGSVDSYDAVSGDRLWTFEDISGNTVASATVVGDFVVLGASPSRRAPASNKAAQSNCCLRLVMKKGKRSYELVWRAKNAVSSFASPLIHQECAYFVNRVGALFCLDLKTGKQNYVQRISSSCWATPIGAGKHIYCFGKDGRTTIIQSGASYKLITKNDLWSEKKTSTAPGSRGGRSMDPVVYGVAVSDSSFLIRTGKKLTCVRADVKRSSTDQ